MEAKEEDEEEEKKEKKEKEKEDNKIGVAEKSFHYCHAWCRFVIAILGLAKGASTLCGPVFLLFFSKGFIRKLLFGNWIRFLESKLLLIKSEGCFGKDLLYLTLLAILKVNGANWLLVLEKNWSWEKSFHYCHVGSTIGHALWTRSEHDSFGNTKSKWS